MNNRHWIVQAINPAHKGALHRQLGIPQDKTIPQSTLNKAANSPNEVLARRAQLAETLSRMNHG